MYRKITIDGLSQENLTKAIKEVRKYKVWVEQKEAVLRQKLAERGAAVARIAFTGATYDGTNDVTVRVDNTGSVAVIYAEGSAVAFIEFGSGITHGYGHPQADEFGMGPGTWSDGELGKGHWDDPHGWYYAHGKKTHGNPPAMAMYKAVQAMTEDLTTIAKEVFSS